MLSKPPLRKAGGLLHVCVQPREWSAGVCQYVSSERQASRRVGLQGLRGQRLRCNRRRLTVEQEGRRYRGFNVFDPDDEMLLCSILRGEFNISGLQNKPLRPPLPELNSGQVSRLLKRLRT